MPLSEQEEKELHRLLLKAPHAGSEDNFSNFLDKVRSEDKLREINDFVRMAAQTIQEEAVYYSQNQLAWVKENMVIYEAYIKNRLLSFDPKHAFYIKLNDIERDVLNIRNDDGATVKQLIATIPLNASKKIDALRTLLTELNSIRDSIKSTDNPDLTSLEAKLNAAFEIAKQSQGGAGLSAAIQSIFKPLSTSRRDSFSSQIGRDLDSLQKSQFTTPSEIYPLRKSSDTKKSK